LVHPSDEGHHAVHAEGTIVHDESNLTTGRARRVLGERLRPEIYGERVQLSLEAAELPGEPIAPAEGPGLDYAPFELGSAWGPAWGTTWFRLRGTVPAGWEGLEYEGVVDLGFDADTPGFQCEALVYRPDVTPVKALNPRNQWIPIDAAPGGSVELYLEAASNPILLEKHPFLPTQQGDVTTASRAPLYRLARAELAVRRPEVAALVEDLDLLLQLQEQQPAGPLRAVMLESIDRALDVLLLDDIAGTAAAARAELAPVLAAHGGQVRHHLAAIGHSHIDTAWLWPQRETIRKVARTMSSMTTLLELDPEFRFGMSSAQQYAWLKEHRPEVYARVKAAVAEGRFEPLGGMWVESDTVMPSGEAMVRQFLEGQRFFEEEFGKRSRGVWLPDSFGYSPALPQLIRRAGFEWFFTQKISWNQVNTFPHHTFFWEGVDGSRVLTHFPPMDTYNAQLLGEELSRAERQFRDARRASGSIAPVGWGDGGGGTTREMLERVKRLGDLDGAPKVRWESPDEFFERTAAEVPDAPVWVGELYLELHRAVTTSQHHTKAGNRRSEHLLVEAEWWATAAWIRAGVEYPHEELQELWRIVLTHQFHDILPGTSIAWVHREAVATYAEVARRLQAIIEASLAALAGEGSLQLSANPTSFSSDGVAPGAIAGALEYPSTSSVREAGGVTYLENDHVSFGFDAAGLLVHAVDLSTGRDYAVPGRPGNLFQLHQDFPNQWDAWDVDRFYRETVTDLLVVSELRAWEEDGAAHLRLSRTFGDSSLSQTFTLRPSETAVRVRQRTEWNEREKFLKLAFPLAVWAKESVAETQFGFAGRPTHVNTSWENAKFETSMQRWVMVPDRDGAVALANDSSYGFDVTRDVLDGAGVVTTLRLSVLRAPRYPDPETDRGTHEHGYALQLGGTELTATELAHELNAPRRALTGARAVAPLVTVGGEGVLLDAVKPAADRSGDLIVRVHEATGHHAAAEVRLDVPFASVAEVSLLEDAPQPVQVGEDGAVRLGLTPLSVRTLRFVLA
jgi:alpha-mannosidase